MKKYIVGCVSLLYAAAAASSSASEISIQFTGEVVNSSCTFSVNGTSDSTVNLGTVTNQIDQFAAPRVLEIEVMACSGDFYGAKVYVWPKDGVGMVPGTNYFLVDDTATGGKARIAFYEDISMEKSWIIGEDSPVEISPDDMIGASYIQKRYAQLQSGENLNDVQAGRISKTLTFTVEYALSPSDMDNSN